MTYEDAKKIVEESNKLPILRQYLQPAKNHSKDSGYCCIFCGSGTGEHGTGAVTIYDDHCTCFSAGCRKTFRNSDIAAHCLGLNDCKGDNFFKVAEFLATEFNLNYLATDEPSTTSKTSATSKVIKQNEGEKAMEQPKQQQPKKDYTNFYQYAESQLKSFIDSLGGKWRGFTYEDLKAVRAGFNKFDDAECVIFPYDNYTYFRRAVDSNLKIKMKNSGGKVQIYNPYDVLGSSLPIFVTEGEIDAVTIHKAGFNAVALGGASQIDIFVNQLESEFSGKAEKPKFIIMLDNNDNGAGQKAASELLSKLRSKNYLAVNVILSPSECYDANEFLQKDFAAFTARVEEIYKSALAEIVAIENEIKSAEELKRNEKFGTPLNYFFENQYLPSTTKNNKFENLKTGFENLQEVQDYESGVYTIGAPPSLGKTSFIWQLMEQMARQNSNLHCVFVSYEMSKEVLFSKSMARGVFENCRLDNPYFELNENLKFSSARVRKGFRYIADDFREDCIEIFQKFKNDTIDLRVLDLTTAPLKIDDLIKRLETIADNVPNDDILIFAIDYLQRIPSEEETAKTAIDDIMAKLKAFTAKTNSIIYLISSFNRAGYKVETGFESFKESGAIEYGSDVIMALQLYIKNDEGEKESTFAAQAKFDSAKAKQPRPMILKCLKNRFGNDYKIYFKYYSAVDCFIPCTESEVREL